MARVRIALCMYAYMHDTCVLSLMTALHMDSQSRNQYSLDSANIDKPISTTVPERNTVRHLTTSHIVYQLVNVNGKIWTVESRAAVWHHPLCIRCL
jgi:hypothetical protein